MGADDGVGVGFGVVVADDGVMGGRDMCVVIVGGRCVAETVMMQVLQATAHTATMLVPLQKSCRPVLTK